MPHRVVPHLAEFDVRERLAPLPAWLSQIAFAIFCLGMEVLLRLVINALAPGAAPFAVIYPGILAATLFAGWQCGFIVLAISMLAAWYFVLPAPMSFRIENPADIPRMLVILLSGSLVIALSDVFRQAAQRAARARKAQVEEQDLLLREIDHRIKNNFMMVASLVDIQRRRSEDAPVKDALAEVLARIDSFARAHNHLYHDPRNVGAVQMKEYLQELCDALAQALTLHGAVTLTCASDQALMNRDRAVSIGLLVNELVTNAAKHAFDGRETGVVNVSFRRHGAGWRLYVEDDGVGLDAAKPQRPGGGLGKRLVDAFVRQANGTLSTESSSAGTRVIVELGEEVAR
ncbi:sensor histidine kinase [Terricaulis sp.]|uniref:sensor histidine kinase n=1 Tax=Terricaulis sp. TaxID=2768686 RepID=UPI002AC741BB|nr:histidine kinase dimerization/phosphoacceptor domain -containing protein [Terricaulis sp.]MDZ4689724.1 histidine kinase dimerization/phosphoacceptor domain -containing protein [Terricaulis sp.]